MENNPSSVKLSLHTISNDVKLVKDEIKDKDVILQRERFNDVILTSDEINKENSSFVKIRPLQERFKDVMEVKVEIGDKLIILLLTGKTAIAIIIEVCPLKVAIKSSPTSFYKLIINSKLFKATNKLKFH